MAELPPFALERYFAEHESDARYYLCSSNCDSLSLTEIIEDLADKEMIGLWKSLSLEYTSYTGHPLLRQEVSQLYKSIKPDEVLIAAPVEGIKIATEALVGPGDHVVCPFPSFQSLYQVAQDKGAHVSSWLPREEEGWNYDVHDLEALIRDDTRLVVLNFPHCPTGYLPTEKEFRRMIAVAERVGAYVLSDEIYRYSEQDESHRLTTACDIYNRAISLHGMSKVFGMPGERIGWLATHDESARKLLQERKDYTSTCAPATGEILAIIGLRAKDGILQRTRDTLTTNLPLLRDFLDRHTDLFSYNAVPQAGTMWLVKLNIPVNSRDFTKRVVDDTGILLLPSTVFDYGESHVRFGFGRQNMPEVLARFEDYLETKPDFAAS